MCIATNGWRSIETASCLGKLSCETNRNPQEVNGNMLSEQIVNVEYRKRWNTSVQTRCTWAQRIETEAYYQRRCMDEILFFVSNCLECLSKSEFTIKQQSCFLLSAVTGITRHFRAKERIMSKNLSNSKLLFFYTPSVMKAFLLILNIEKIQKLVKNSQRRIAQNYACLISQIEH